MKDRDLWKCVLVCFMACTSVVGFVRASSAKPRPVTESGGVAGEGVSVREDGRDTTTRLAETLVENLVEGLDVPPAAFSSFENLYQRYKTEIDRFIQDNPTLVWESLDVLMDALPGLKRIRETGGNLYIPKRTFARASQLIDDAASKVSPPLARDLTRIKSAVRSLFHDVDGREMMIDLNELARLAPR